MGTSDQDTDRSFESSFAGEKQDAAVCRQELFKIENYVEMALNYLRFEEMSNDLVLERNSLEQLVRQVVKNMQQFLSTIIFPFSWNIWIIQCSRMRNGFVLCWNRFCRMR